MKRLWLSLVPVSRRERVGLFTDEVFDRVGGFMLGNLLTSVVAGIGTYVWLSVFGVPYALLLALLVALFDLIPMVGSTIAGVVVTLVAFTKGCPLAIATGVFYIVYRFVEDYLLNPRVMKHTVKVSPGLTIIATLVGGTLLGLIGALVAIPVAATFQLLLEEVRLLAPESVMRVARPAARTRLRWVGSRAALTQRPGRGKRHDVSVQGSTLPSTSRVCRCGGAVMCSRAGETYEL